MGNKYYLANSANVPAFFCKDLARCLFVKHLILQQKKTFASQKARWISDDAVYQWMPLCNIYFVHTTQGIRLNRFDRSEYVPFF